MLLLVIESELLMLILVMESELLMLILVMESELLMLLLVIESELLMLLLVIESELLMLILFMGILATLLMVLNISCSLRIFKDQDISQKSSAPNISFWFIMNFAVG